MTYGLTDTGFNQKRLADVISEAESNLSLIVDLQTGFTLQPDFDSSDPAMQIVKVPLEGVASAWEMLTLVINQFDPNKATGPILYGLVQLNGLNWSSGAPSTVNISVTGVAGRTIPAGRQITDAAGSMTWVTDADIIIGGGGTATGTASSISKGPYTAPIGTLTVIKTNVSGWNSVTNPDAAIPGSFAETDTQLRRRRDNSTMAPASAPAEAIYSNLLNLDGVTYARVYINNTLLTDSRGIPGKNVAAVVVGGDDTEIAKVLLARTDMSNWYGNSAVVLYDLQGTGYAVKFIRPDEIAIWVEMDITTYPSFPTDGVAQIKAAILAYAISGSDALPGVSGGFETEGFVPGSTVIATMLYTPANYVPGHRIDRLEIGVSSGVVSTDNIVCAFDEAPIFDEARIDIIPTPA